MAYIIRKFLMDEANKALEIAIENTINGNYKEAFNRAYEARNLNPELPDIKRLVTLLQVLHADPDTTHYEILGVEETANENEIRSAFHKLSADLNPDTNMFPKASEAFCRISEAMRVLSHDRSKYDNDLAVARGACTGVAEYYYEAVWSNLSFNPFSLIDAEYDAFARCSDVDFGNYLFSHYSEPRVGAKRKAPARTFDEMISSSMNTETLLEANKDDALRAQEIAITKANQGEYHDALKFARKAQRMDPDLPKIKKLVASMEILSASSDTTHYKLLGVEETDDATKIRSAYRKLSIDVHPDQNTFPKASEAFNRIAIAARVLSDEESRAKYDHALAATREAAARKSSAPEVVSREDAATCDFYDAFSGESFSTDTSCTDTSYTDASSSDDSSTNASSTDDVGPGSKRVSDTQSTSTLHTPKKRKGGHGPF